MDVLRLLLNDQIRQQERLETGMGKAIGMIEFKTVSAGITAADRMVKTADVELLEAQTVCPGKYIALIS